MTIDEMDLRHAITDLRDAYYRLEAAAYESGHVQLARRMKPRPGPRSPLPSGDWPLSLETSLLWETTDDTVPGGLLTMAHDALTYTDAGDQHIQPTSGAMVCAHLWRNAGEICWKFPAAGDLLELLQDQTAHIHKALRKHNPTITGPSIERRLEAHDRYAGATTIANLASTIIGKTIDRRQLTHWVATGRLAEHLDSTGKPMYSLSEVIHVARTITDRRRNPSHGA